MTHLDRKHLVLLLTMLLVFVAIYLYWGSSFRIYPDSYEYLLIARNLVGGSHTIDLFFGNQQYWATSFLFSRFGYALLMAGGSLVSRLDLAQVPALINLFFFSVNTALLGYWALFKARISLLRFIIIIGFFLFSYTNMFWLNIAVSDFAGQSILLLCALYALAKKRTSPVAEVALLFAALLIRLELVLPLLIILIAIKRRSLLTLIKESVVAGILYLLTLLLLVQDKQAYLDLNLKTLGSLNIDPLILVLFIFAAIATLVLLSRKKIHLKPEYFLYIVFLVLGLFFADSHSLAATLANGGFLLTHELPMLALFAVVMIFALRHKPNQAIHLALVFLASIFAYHLYFQHLVIYLPLVVVFAVESLKNVDFAKIVARHDLRLIAKLVLSLLPAGYLLLAFSTYSLRSGDAYGDFFSNHDVNTCLQNDLKTSFLIPTLYYQFDRRQNISEVSGTDFNVSRYNYLLDEVFVENSGMAVNPPLFNSVTSTGAMIVNTRKYAPVFYGTCL